MHLSLFVCATVNIVVVYMDAAEMCAKQVVFYLPFLSPELIMLVLTCMEPAKRPEMVLAQFIHNIYKKI